MLHLKALTRQVHWTGSAKQFVRMLKNNLIRLIKLFVRTYRRNCKMIFLTFRLHIIPNPLFDKPITKSKHYKQAVQINSCNMTAKILVNVCMCVWGDKVPGMSFDPRKCTNCGKMI